MTAEQYVESRGLPASVASEWFLRYGWDGSWPKLENRIVIPIFSFTGKLLALAGRSLSPEDKPKYLFTPGWDKNKWLYGVWREIKSIPVIVEGYLDVWALDLCGYTGFAVMGSAMSDWQAALIAGMSDKAIIYPHNDDDGVEWKHKLKSYGVKSVIPAHPYPIGAPVKTMGDQETADPHWLYVNQKVWLEANLDICRRKLKGPSLEDIMKEGRT